MTTLDESGSAPPAARASGGGGASAAYRKRIGPLPVWGWMLAVLVLAVGYYLWKKRTASASAAASTSSAATGTTQADQTPPFIIQNYTSYPGQMQTPTTPTPTQGRPPVQGGNPPGNPVPATPPSNPTSTPPAVGSTSTINVVTHPGDTWASVAGKYGISGAHLQQFNSVQANRKPLPPINTKAPLAPGSTVVVPWLNK